MFKLKLGIILSLLTSICVAQTPATPVTIPGYTPPGQELPNASQQAEVPSQATEAGALPRPAVPQPMPGNSQPVQPSTPTTEPYLQNNPAANQSQLPSPQPMQTPMHAAPPVQGEVQPYMQDANPAVGNIQAPTTPTNLNQ